MQNLVVLSQVSGEPGDQVSIPVRADKKPWIYPKKYLL